LERYFPVPTRRRDVKLLPPMMRGGSTVAERVLDIG